MNEKSSEFLWNVHGYLCTFIQFADVKAAAILAWSGAIIGWLIEKGQFEFVCSGKAWSDTACLALLSAATFAVTLCALAACILVIAPSLGFARNKERVRARGADNLVYWKSILSMTRQNYVEQTKADNELDRATANHVYDLASVAYHKYRCLNVAIWIAAGGTALAILLLAISSLLEIAPVSNVK